MDFKFVLHIIYINIKGKTQLEVIWTQIDLFGLQKSIKMAISQNAILAQCQLPKSLLLLHFLMNLSQTFRIDVNMDFANNLVRGFLIYAPKKISAQNPKKTVLRILGSVVFEVGHLFGRDWRPQTIRGTRGFDTPIFRQKWPKISKISIMIICWIFSQLIDSLLGSN